MAGRGGRYLAPISKQANLLVQFRWMERRLDYLVAQKKHGITWASCTKKTSVEGARMAVFNAGTTFARVQPAKFDGMRSENFSKPCLEEA